MLRNCTVRALRQDWSHHRMLWPHTCLQRDSCRMLNKHHLRVHHRLRGHLVRDVRVGHGHVLVHCAWHRLSM